MMDVPQQAATLTCMAAAVQELLTTGKTSSLAVIGDSRGAIAGIRPITSGKPDLDWFARVAEDAARVQAAYVAVVRQARILLPSGSLAEFVVVTTLGPGLAPATIGCEIHRGGEPPIWVGPALKMRIDADYLPPFWWRPQA